jgi:hypothetical protein
MNKIYYVENKDIIINPYYYTKYANLSTISDKIDTINKYLDNLNLDNKIITLLKNIKEELNKAIVYEFGCVDDLYILKIFLHGKNINNVLNDINIDQKEFYNNILKVVNILKNFYNFTIDEEYFPKYIYKIITREYYNVYSISFNINLYNLVFDNIIYFHCDYYNEVYHIKLEKVAPIEFDLLMAYNINTNEITYNNINKLLYNLKQVNSSYKFLSNDCNVEPLIHNLDEIINNNFIRDNNLNIDTLNIQKLLNYNWFVIFEYIIDKEYLKSIKNINLNIDNIDINNIEDNIKTSNSNILIIKVINTSYNELIKFLKYYKLDASIINNIENNELSKKLKYDLFIYININICKIIGASFLNYF